MEEILYNNGFISKRSIAASIGGRNDMGRLLSPAGRDIIINNISKHKLPLIKNSKLAENIDERMKLFSSHSNPKDFSAMINIGGGVASLGTSFNSKLLNAGIVKRSDVIDISLREGGIEGVLSKFAKNNVPILHVLNIKSLTEQLNMPFAPIPVPEIGAGGLYAEKKYNIFIAAVCLVIISGLVFAIGYHSKQKIKEHLVDHEPDSLL
jgi:poly-gamma-glutamate system protein